MHDQQADREEQVEQGRIGRKEDGGGAADMGHVVAGTGDRHGHGRPHRRLGGAKVVQEKEI